MEVFVFKTNIRHKYQVKKVKSKLDELGKWNFDLEDCDNILRIESNQDIAFRVIKTLQAKDFECVELE